MFPSLELTDPHGQSCLPATFCRTLIAGLLALLLAACGAEGADTPTPVPVATLRGTATSGPTWTAHPPAATPTGTLAPPTATLPHATATLAPPTATPVPPPAVAVLVYHHFGVPASGDYDCPLPKFEQQLQWLQAHGYQSVMPDQLVAALQHKATLPAHPIVFTFDDNNIEQYTGAAPILERYGYHGAFFIDTVTIGKRHFMSAPQLEDLERRGNLIGSHTWDHRDLAILTMPEVRDQLDKSEADLLDILGHKPRFISYPYGMYNADDVAELQARGYQGGFRLRDGGLPDVDPTFRIPRQVIPGAWRLAQFVQNVHSMEAP